jgi:hypothetical protein
MLGLAIEISKLRGFERVELLALEVAKRRSCRRSLVTLQRDRRRVERRLDRGLFRGLRGTVGRHLVGSIVP